MDKEETKICSKCHKEKALSMFRARTDRENKFRSVCLACERIDTRIYELKHKVERAERQRRPENKLKLKEYHSRPENKLRAKELSNLHIKEKRASSKKYRDSHVDEERAYRRLPEVMKKRRESAKKQYSSPMGSLGRRMSSLMWHSLKHNKNSIHWENLVGYTINELKKHIERLFTEGMTWKVFLTGKIHIDHIIPRSVFNYELPTDIDFQRCWSLSNLQPMWAEDNLRKSDKLKSDFQPALRI